MLKLGRIKRNKVFFIIIFFVVHVYAQKYFFLKYHRLLQRDGSDTCSQHLQEGTSCPRSGKIGWYSLWTRKLMDLNFLELFLDVSFRAYQNADACHNGVPLLILQEPQALLEDLRQELPKLQGVKKGMLFPLPGLLVHPLPFQPQQQSQLLSKTQIRCSLPTQAFRQFHLEVPSCCCVAPNLHSVSLEMCRVCCFRSRQLRLLQDSSKQNNIKNRVKGDPTKMKYREAEAPHPRTNSTA